MAPRKKFNITKYVKYDTETNKSMCLIEHCDRRISGKRPANIKRHYKLMHKMKIDEDDDSDSNCNQPTAPVSKKPKIRVKDNTTMDMDIGKFVKCEIETCKSTPLVKPWKKELSEQRPENKKNERNYELIHMVKPGDEDSDGDGNEPGASASNQILSKVSDGITIDKNEFIKFCVGLVAVKNIPFQIFDDQDYFKKILGPYEQKFGIDINCQNIGLIVEKASEEIKDIITRRIDKIMVCLKVDIATRIEKSILNISIQYIKDFKIYINTIGLIEITEIPTAEFLKEEILKCLQDFKIDIAQLYSNTVDKCPYIMSISKIKQEVQEQNICNTQDSDRDEKDIHSKITTVFPVIRCAAHALQLAAYDVVKTVEPEVNTCRQIVRKFLTSGRAEDIYSPFFDNMTNWDKTFSMIYSILVQKECIENLEDAIRIGIDWNFIKDFVRAFKPVVDCTLKLQCDQYIFGDFYRDWLSCELELLDIADGNLYASRLHEAMATKKNTLIENDVFIAALYLDPRFNFNASPLLNDDQKNVALKHLLKTYEKIQQLEGTSSISEEEKFDISKTTSLSTECSLMSSDKYNKLEKHIQQMIASSTTTALTNISLKQKLSLLCERSMEPLDTNVLEYWTKYYRHDRELSKIAEVVLAAPVTHEPVDVERAFSALSNELSTKRALLYNFNSDLLQSCNLDFIEIEEILRTETDNFETI